MTPKVARLIRLFRIVALRVWELFEYRMSFMVYRMDPVRTEYPRILRIPGFLPHRCCCHAREAKALTVLESDFDFIWNGNSTVYHLAPLCWEVCVGEIPRS